MVSGDDDTCAYVLTPNDESVNDWTYTQTLVKNFDFLVFFIIYVKSTFIEY